MSSALIISQMESSCVHLLIDKPLKSSDLRKNTELEATPTLLFSDRNINIRTNQSWVVVLGHPTEQQIWHIIY